MEELEKGATPGDPPTTQQPASPEPTAEGPQPIAGLTEGHIVHFVTDRPLSAGETPDIRPAMIVRIWDRLSGCVNLQVFTDGDNDLKFTDSRGSNVVWKTSRLYSETREPGTWHWPPRA
jgi:hypothetical protein